MLSNILDRISFWSLFVVIVLIPVFFLPFTKIPIETSKGLLLIAGLTVSIICWTVARFSDGKITIPKSWLLVSGFGIVFAFLLSAIFSASSKVSFFGTMLDSGTFYFILSAFLLMLISSIILRDFKKVELVFLGVIISSALVLVFQTLHLFMPNFLSLGILGANTDNILGSWSAFGIFAGFFALIALFVLEFFPLSKLKKILFIIFLVLSVLLVAVVNFSTVWAILGIFALIIFIYKLSISFNGEEERKKKVFPISSFVIIMISLLFFMAGQFIGGFLPNQLGVSNLEVRPSFSATMSVAKNVLAKDPILGAGPNRFTEMWNIHKPATINNTQFWNVSFDSGSGALPTFAITTGALGILAWLAFLVLFILSGFKPLFNFKKKNVLNIEVVILFFLALYLFVSSFFYPIGSALLLLAFAFLGIFIGLSSNGKKDLISFSFLNDPRKSFFSILILVVIMITSAAAGFKYIERFVSISHFQKTVSAESIESAQASITKAISLHSNDLYLRTYSQVYLIKLNNLIAKGDSITEIEKADLQVSLDRAISGAQLAVQYNNMNYLNFRLLGSIFESVVPFGVEGAHDKAVEAYKKASTLNPFNPVLKLDLARLAFTSKDVQGAKNYANEALTLKPNYIDALITLSQIAKSAGDNMGALNYAEKAFLLSPDNSNLEQYVDSLKNISVSESIAEENISENN